MRLLLLVGVASLAGCAAAAQRRAYGEARSAAAECRAAYAMAKGTAMERVLCLERANQIVGKYQMADLSDLMNSFAEGIAKKVDDGSLSGEDGSLMMAEEKVKIAGISQDRANAAMQARAAMASALLQNSPGIYQTAQPYQLAPYQMKSPITTNCQRFGALINCTTY